MDLNKGITLNKYVMKPNDHEGRQSQDLELGKTIKEIKL